MLLALFMPMAFCVVKPTLHAEVDIVDRYCFRLGRGIPHSRNNSCTPSSISAPDIQTGLDAAYNLGPCAVGGQEFNRKDLLSHSIKNIRLKRQIFFHSSQSFHLNNKILNATSMMVNIDLDPFLQSKSKRHDNKLGNTQPWFNVIQIRFQDI